MARESVKILQGKLDVESLIAQLNAALAEEWLAYYQYWVGALVVEGAMRADVQGEFEEHAEEERGGEREADRDSVKHIKKEDDIAVLFFDGVSLALRAKCKSPRTGRGEK